MDEWINSLNNLDDLIKYNSKMVEVIGDCPNIEIPILPDNPLWRTIDRKDDYMCQVSILSGKSRLCKDNIRVANGSKAAMLEKMKRLSAKEFLRLGDVLGVSRNGLYEHYAIYLGNDRVIHYCGETKDFGGRVTVHEAPIEEFIKDSKTYFVVWFDNGMPVKIQKSTSFLFNSSMDFYNGWFQRKKCNVFSEKETVKRAMSRIGEENYNLVTNNCEHFAMWCKTGVAESSQVKNIVRAALATEVKGYGLNTPEARKLLTTT